MMKFGSSPLHRSIGYCNIISWLDENKINYYLKRELREVS